MCNISHEIQPSIIIFLFLNSLLLYFMGFDTEGSCMDEQRILRKVIDNGLQIVALCHGLGCMHHNTSFEET
jgi:hypothetical protein